MPGKETFTTAEAEIIRRAAEVDPGFAQKVATPGGWSQLMTSAVSDYQIVSPLRLDGDYSHLNAGANLLIQFLGTVKDLSKGSAPIISDWQLVVAAAVLNAQGQPDPTMRNFKHIKSINQSWAQTLAVRDVGQTNLALDLGTMPSYNINVAYRLYGNHDSGPSWDWSKW